MVVGSIDRISLGSQLVLVTVPCLIFSPLSFVLQALQRFLRLIYCKMNFSN